MTIKRILSFLLAVLMSLFLLSSCSDIDISGIIDEVEDILKETETETADNEGAVSSVDIPEETVPGDTTAQDDTGTQTEDETASDVIDENGTYTTKDDVALYIHIYGKLPGNFITKDEARALGWEGGGLESYAPGKCIGGDYFGNYEGLLPEKKGRKYTECDIDTLGKSSRGAKRIIFSNDGLIYYTDDHYESFTLLYGEP